MPFVLTFLEQHSLALLILWIVTATLSWSIARKKSPVRDGLDLRFLGNVLIILAVAAVLLFHASGAFPLTVFLMGFSVSVIGRMKFRSARRSRLERSTSERAKKEA